MKGVFKTEKSFLIVIFAIAFFIRLAFLVFYQDGKLLSNEYFEQDTKLYAHMAESITLHKTPDAVNLQDPDYPAQLIGFGYPLFLAAAFTIFGKSFLAVRIIQALLGALTCLLLYWLCRQVLQKRCCMVAAALLAFEPFHIYRTGSILTEVLFVFLLTASFLYLYKGINSKRTCLFLLGNVFLILAGLCRAAAFGLYPFMLVWVLLVFWKDKLKMAKYAAWALVFSFLVIYLWHFILPAFYPSRQVDPADIKCAQGASFFNTAAVFSANFFVSMSSSAHLGITHSEYHDWRSKLYESIKGLPSCEARKKTAEEFFTFLRKHPASVLKVVYQKFINFWRIYPNSQEPGKPVTEFGGRGYKIISLLSYGLLLPFFVIGLFALAKEYRKMFLLYSLVFLFTCIHVIQCSQIRYRLQIIPAFIIFASYGLIWGWRMVCRGNN